MRSGNFYYMKMSMDKLSGLYYGLNMTTYMYLWFRFEKMMARALEDVQSFLEHNMCMPQSGYPS